MRRARWCTARCGAPGLVDAEAAGLGLAFYAFILGYALAEAEGLLRPISDDDEEELRALDPLDCPATLALIPAFKALDRDAAFDASVDAFIDGVSCRCKRLRGRASRCARSEQRTSRCSDVAFQRGVEDLAAPLLGQRNGIAAGGRIVQRHFDDGIDAAAVDAKSLQIVGNAGLLAQIEHGREEAIEPAGNAEIAGEPLDLRLDRRAVEDEHIGHEHAVGRAVMGVVEGADRMRQRVDRAEALLEGGGAHRRRAHHVGARLDIVAIGHGLGQVHEDEPHALDGNALGHGVVARGAIGFEAMGQRVHAGARR